MNNFKTVRKKQIEPFKRGLERANDCTSRYQEEDEIVAGQMTGNRKTRYQWALVGVSFFLLNCTFGQVLDTCKTYIYAGCFESNDTTVHYLLSLKTINPDWDGDKIIRYSYYANEDSLKIEQDFFWEETLATENDKWFALHPPRGIFNSVNQMLPFPEIPKNAAIGTSWNEKLIIGRDWRDLFPGIKKVVSAYLIADTVQFEFKGTSYNAHKVIALSKNKQQYGYAIYLYIPTLGIVHLINGYGQKAVRLELIDIIYHDNCVHSRH